MRVVVYSKPACPLCDELKDMLVAFQLELGFELVERNILENDADFAQYRYLIPVLDIEGGALFYPPHHWDVVRDALHAAQRQTA